MGEGVPRSRSSSEIMSYYLYMKNQNPARALEAMKQVQISDKRPALMAPLIAAYLAIGQDQKAKEFISQQPDTAQKGLTEFMSKLLPDKDFIGQWALCTYFEMNHQDAAAFLAIQELYKKWPKSDLAIQMYAAQLSAIRAFGEAAKVLSTLPDPNLTQQVALVQLWTSARQGEKAIVLAEKIADEHPNLKGIHAVLGDFWMQKDKLKALAYFEKELVNNPNNIIVLNNLAWEYGIVQKDLTKVMPILNRLKQEKNLDPRILDTMGWILAQNGKADEAENYIRNAMTIVPDFPTFLYHMGFIQSQLGKKVEAKKYLENALASKIPFEERKDVETLLATF